MGGVSWIGLVAFGRRLLYGTVLIRRCCSARTLYGEGGSLVSILAIGFRAAERHNVSNNFKRVKWKECILVKQGY